MENEAIEELVNFKGESQALIFVLTTTTKHHPI
jgi:hypothetical protein